MSNKQVQDIVNQKVEEAVSGIRDLIRQQINEALSSVGGQAAMAMTSAPSLAAPVRKVKRGRKPGPKRGTTSHLRQCIAPGCRHQSKGPRFHYLCDEHKGAGKREIQTWRALSRGDLTPDQVAAGVTAPKLSRRGTQGRKRGRPPGSKNKVKTVQAAPDAAAAG